MFGKILRTGIVTEDYPRRKPLLPEGVRGRHRFDPALCDGCGRCVPVCPSGAVTVSGGGFSLRWDACHFCGRCTEACPHEALHDTPDFEMAGRDRSRLGLTAGIGSGSIEVAAAGTPMGGPAEAVDSLSREVAERARALFGRSLHVRHLDAGSCNGCDFEIAALLNPVYDVQRFGIDFVASPRHADLALVTGPVTRHLEEAVRRTVEAMPAPRLVVAVGACACGGGIHRATYAAAGGADEVVPVDVYVPGCPPRPEAILRGLLMAMGRV